MQTQGRAASRARMSLIAAQLALTGALLVAVGLFLSSFARVLGTDRGFRTEHALALDVVVPSSAYLDGAGLERVYSELLERLRRVPGVSSAAATSRLPLDGVTWADAMSAENDVRPSEEWPLGYFNFVTPDYFTALDIAVRGESFSDRDRRSVVVLSARAASQVFPDGEDPIGRRVRLGGQVMAEVIGVAGDVAATGIAADPSPIAYLPPWTPFDFAAASSIAAHGHQAADAHRIGARRRARGRPGIAIARVRTLEQMVGEATAARRFQLSLLLLFATTALVTACVGIYGVVAHSLAGRREIGVRIALGPRRGDIHRLVVGQGVAAAVIGVAAGLVGAGLGRFVQSMFYGVDAADPLALAAVATLLAAVTAAASWIPARRATVGDLTGTLRE